MFPKIPPKFHDKAVQSNILWLNLNKINEISILQSAGKQGNPRISLSCAGLKTQIPMHSNSIGCPKIFPPSALVLYWLSQLTCISSLKAKNEQKTLFFTQIKISRYKQILFVCLFFFCYFRRSKTNKRLKERFLIEQNRTKRAIFRGRPLLQATYNRKTEKQTVNSTYLVSTGCKRLAEGKGHETD